MSTEVTKILTDDIQDPEVEVEIGHLAHEKSLQKELKGQNREVLKERKAGIEGGTFLDRHEQTVSCFCRIYEVHLDR